MYYTHRRIRALTPTCVAGEVASLTSQVKGLEQDLKLERLHALNQEKQLRDLAAKADGASERARALRLEQELANTRLLLQDKIAHGTALENKLIELTGEKASRAACLHACACLPAVRACFGGKRS